MTKRSHTNTFSQKTTKKPVKSMLYKKLSLHQKINANSAFRDISDVHNKDILEIFYRAPYPSWHLSKINKDPPPTKPKKKVTFKDFRKGWVQLSLFN